MGDKFTRNKELGEHLRSSGTRKLYEATLGKRWGVNCNNLRSKLFEQNRTTGENVCGWSLEATRDLLFPQIGQ